MGNRSITAVLAVALAAGAIFAAGSEAPTGAARINHDMTVQVVSVDKRAKTITIKDDKGETKGLPVLGHAVQRLSMVRTGGMFTLTCEDNEKGEHQGIIAIKAVKSSAK